MRIPHTLAGGLVSIAAATLFSQPVTALSQGQPCHENGRLLRAEARAHGLEDRGWGVGQFGSLVWLFVNPETGEWAYFETFDDKDGPGCRFSSGTDWHWLPLREADDD